MLVPNLLQKNKIFQINFTNIPDNLLIRHTHTSFNILCFTNA